VDKYRKSQEVISKLTPEQYRVTQQNATERPGTGAYLENKEPGIYVDIVSGIVGQVRLRLRVAEFHETDRTRQRQRIA